MNRRFCFIIGVVMMSLVISCKPQVPRGVIQPDEMEDLLVEYHLAYALASRDGGRWEERDYRQTVYIEEMLRKHGHTKAEFDSSLVYYYSRADMLIKIFERVSDRLDKQALSMGASVGEIGRYSSLNANGDTANIWVGEPCFLLKPQPPYNRFDFEIKVDTTFRQGDNFLFQFVSDFFFQSGGKSCAVVLSLTYDNDSIITRSTHFSSSGLGQLRFDGPKDLKLKHFRGFFYLSGGNEQTTVLRLLFMNNIQLIRFHTQKADEQPIEKKVKADSLTIINDPRGTVADTTSSRDSVRKGGQVLSSDRRTAVHRVE